MHQNMGPEDRLGRGLLVTPVLVWVAALTGFGSAVGIIALVVAAAMVATAAVGYCPVYALLHLHTDDHDHHHAT